MAFRLRSTLPALAAMLAAQPALAELAASPSGGTEVITLAALQGDPDAIAFGQRVDEALEDVFQSFEPADGALIADPFESVNRSVFGFNQRVDRRVLVPTINVYRAVVPQFGRSRMRDFIDNIKTPVWFVNEVLQGDFDGAGIQATRFTLNTTVGVAGLFDVAAHGADLKKDDEDFGQTLGRWGVGDGAYVVLPFLGPSSLRDAAGRGVDNYLSPWTFVQFENDVAYRVTYSVVDVVDIREQVDQVIRATNLAPDPYIQQRSVYVQLRREKIAEAIEVDADTGSQIIDLDDYEDEYADEF